jgi:glutamine---fructose-6-phosphate transaminase (isomerizing)
MCGIIGVVANNQIDISPFLIEGLKRLEYRGYDSAGIATLSTGGELVCRRSEGKLSALQHEIQKNPISGNTGIGHTRWATHGRPTRVNAHPHVTSKVAVVHNGIIENFRELRARLEAEGRILTSDTDTEVIPHLITHYLEQGLLPTEAVTETLKLLSGTFALAILFAGKEQFMMATRRGSPLAIGHGEGQMYVGSDTVALAPFTSRISYLEDGDIAELNKDEVVVWDKHQDRVNRLIRSSSVSGLAVGKNGYRHYMLKEIHEQPAVLAETLRHYIYPRTKTLKLPALPFDLANIPEVTMVACGTSYYAAMVGKYWLEQVAHLPVSLDIASEFRYRETPLKEKGLALFISQSGETADTLAAMHLAHDHKQHILSLVNRTESTMAMSSDVVFPLMAGAEIGVASTKAFTAQLSVLACLTLAFADARGASYPEGYGRDALVEALMQLPALAMNVLGCDEALHELAQEIARARNVLYIGRGTSYPVALEGALKLKELTYIHAEGIAAGELKHGPIALIDEEVPVIALAPSDRLFEKTCSNIEEVSARSGKVVAFCDAKGAKVLKNTAKTIVLPECHPLLTPLLYAIPMQLLAYHVALIKGSDVDQPRNLAKSVTVE